MLKSQIYAVIISLIMIFGLCTADFAMAGEKIKAHGASAVVESEQIEVGDVEGHVIAITKSKAVYFDESTGEITPQISVGLMDFNLNSGMGSGYGYGISTLKNGDKRISRWESKSVEKGHMKGTFTITKGTGKLEGIKGGGTFESYSLGSGQSHVEVEGEFEIPGQ